MRLRPPVVHVDCGTDGFAEMVGSVTVGVVVGRVLDLILGHRDVDLLVVTVDPLDDPGGDHALLAEDPESGVDDQPAR